MCIAIHIVMMIIISSINITVVYQFNRPAPGRRRGQGGGGEDVSFEIT